VKLGLDLKGGVHLVLRVQTDDALRVESETAMERMRGELVKAGASAVTASSVSPTTFEVAGVPQAQEATLRQLSSEIENTYNRESRAGGAYRFTMKLNIAQQLRNDTVTQAIRTIENRVNGLGVAEPVVAGPGGAYRFTMKLNIAQQLRNDTVTQAIRTIENRVNGLGVAEPVVARHGGADQILVQLPGVTDVARAKEIIRSTALLELKLVEAGPASTREALLQASGGAVPQGAEVIQGLSEGTAPGERASTVFYLVQRSPVVTGRDLRTAKPTLDEFNRPAVSFSLKQDGAVKFGNATGSNIGRNLAIILDKQVYSAPVIEGRITDEGRISGGNFTPESAQDLSLTLRSGALPASLTYLEERTVGPSLGRDSIRAGVMASVTGLALVTLFMLGLYKLSGINAIVAMAINLLVLLALMAYSEATMTLPGIAGFILTIGMGVDSNVLIFERIKEEIAAQKSVRSAVAAGFDRVFLTILDTHIASLIAAAFLFQFGTGPIRGFATTLTIGLLTNVFTSIFVSRALFELVLGKRQTATLSI
jgi:preprotein translocase subunit SecD